MAQLTDSQKEFVALLNNQPKQDKPRDRGFVVLVEEQRSLAQLQDACFQQTYNHCYTARYRMRAGAVFGTLRAALQRDIANALADKAVAGEFRPALSEVGEQSVLAGFNVTPKTEDSFSVHSFESVLTEIERLSRKSVGARLVLFCECTDDAFDEAEWRVAGETFLHRLPERVGLVFSGVPETICAIVEQTASSQVGPAPKADYKS